MLRAICNAWLSTASARDAFSLTMISAPTRSRYSPKFFEFDTEIADPKALRRQIDRLLTQQDAGGLRMTRQILAILLES